MASAAAQLIPNLDRSARARPGALQVRAWLYTLAVLVMVMVAIGGATRLTGSGLSITEWKPVTGAIPPLSEAGWEAEFAKYRVTSQYLNLNEGMSLADFRFIYWWEWSHRQLGRLIGLAFFIPLLVFWRCRTISPRQALTYLLIGSLGGLQAIVGWIMVASGLEPGMVAVAPIKLALHLAIASVILMLLVWHAAGWGKDRKPLQVGLRPQASGAFRVAPALVALILLQIALGGLVAGSKAGLTYNTWPLMDGHLVPPVETLFVVRPLAENFVDNPALVQFQHRSVAYLIVLLACWHAVASWRASDAPAEARRALAVAALAVAQMVLGIVTLLLSVPLWAGLAHQLLAMALLVAATIQARYLAGETSVSGRACSPA